MKHVYIIEGKEMEFTTSKYAYDFAYNLCVFTGNPVHFYNKGEDTTLDVFAVFNGVSDVFANGQIILSYYEDRNNCKTFIR